MRNIVNEYIRQFEENRRSRRRTIGIISALALLVAFGVFWNLHSTGVALTGDAYYCGMEEHTHDDSCYAWVLSDTASEESEAAESADAAAEAEVTQSSEAVPEAETTGETSEEEAAADIAASDSAGADAVADTAASDSTVADAASGEEQASETAEESASSDSETVTLPSMVLVTEATESEDWYLNHGYVKTLICELEEHTHTSECLVNVNADRETAEDWEATLPEELNGTAAENLVAVAVSQLGYTESTANYTLAEDGVTRKGYTRYGAWYGNAYADWDTMFIAFCLHYAGVAEEDFPINSGAYAWAVQLDEADLYADADEYVPSAGDVIFLDTNADEKADQTGIIETLTVDPETADVTLTVILANVVDEGESGKETSSADTVCEAEYALNDETILGYGVLPDVEVNPPVNGPETAAAVELEEQTLTVTTEDGVTVTLSGMLPVDATVSAEPVDVELTGIKVLFALEISIYDADGNEFEPEDDTITVTVVSNDITERSSIYYLPEEGDPEEIASDAVEGTVSFDADHFSTYLGYETYYDYYIAKIDELWVEAYALEDGDISGANDLSSALGDLVDEAEACVDTEDLTKEEYDSIYAYAETLWEYIDENYDPNGAISLTADSVNNWTIIGENTQVIQNTRLNLINTSAEVYSESKKLKIQDENETVTYPFVTYDISKNEMEGMCASGSGEININTEEYVLFTNAGYVDGKSVDVKVTVKKLTFQNFYGTDSTFPTRCEKYKGALRLMCLYGTSVGMGNGGEGNDDGYSYPVEFSVTVQIEIVYHDDKTAVDSDFLVAVRDIDVYMEARNWTETVYLQSGFNGNFYKYDANVNTITPTDTVGVLTIAANNTTQYYDGQDENGVGLGTGLNDSNTTAAGIYAETNGNSWTMAYQDNMNCGTLLEVYIPNYTVTVEKSNKNYTETLSGVEFYLYYIENGDKYYYSSKEEWVTDITKATKLSDDSGVVTINNLYWGTYYLQEATAPKNYALLSDPVEFTLSMGGTLTTTSTSVAKIDSNNSLKLIVSNEPAYDITVKKVNSKDETVTLNGVKFILSNSTTRYYYYIDTSGVVSWVSSQDDATELITDTEGENAGVFTIYDLKPGTYTLTEMETTDGYILLDHSIEITVGDGGEVSVPKNESSAFVSGDVNSTVILTVKNTPGYELPFTGGTGTTVFTCFGVLLITSAVWFIYMKQRQRKSQIASGT